MAEYGSLPSSPKETHKKFIRLFSGFTSKGIIADSESLLSPTSILDTKPFSAFRNPFWSDSNSKPTKPKPRSKLEADSMGLGGVGLAIVDALKDDKSTPNFSKPDNRMVLFGSQLKIQIPLLPPSSVFQSPAESPQSPADFGIKTRNAQVGQRRSGSRSPPGCLSASEMELSEDYTRVISYGPNPKTTHIFDDCIVDQSCGGEVVGFPAAGNKSTSCCCSSESFLSFCCSCKKSLGHGNDIYMYRGEKAFCSTDCRYKEMMLEEEEEEAEEMKKKVKVELDEEDDDDLFW